MATAEAKSADISIKVMEDDLSCNICYNLLREPKELDCPHVFCLECLLKWGGKKPTVECPECRFITIVPKGGPVNLKTNLRLKSMAEKYAERIDKQKDIPLCQNHDGEKQHFFCATCGVTVCHNCLVLEHQRPQHDIKELKKIAKTKKTDVKTKISNVDKKVKETEGEEKKLDKMTKKLQAARKQANDDIEKRVQDIITDAEVKGKEMKAAAEASYQQRMGMLNKEQHHRKDMLTLLQNVRTASQNTVDSAADHVFMKQHASLLDKMDKLCMIELKMPSPNLTTVLFKPGSGPVNASWFGEVAVGGNRKCELKLIHEFGEFQQAQGVAVSQSGLLAVVDYDAGEVVIYRDVNGKYKQQFTLGSSSGDPNGKISKPFKVAVTSGGKFLVAHDRLIAKIFSSSGKYEKTLTDVGDRITTTPDDLIVTGISLTGDITVHQASGELIRKHQVNCKSISNIASNGKQIALTTSKEGKSIHVIDFVTGQTVWTVDMVMPLGICYEPKTNLLLVAGGSTTRKQYAIEQYCSKTGHLMSRVASGLYNPLSLTVTQDSKLVVADLKTVKIFDIKIQ